MTVEAGNMPHVRTCISHVCACTYNHESLSDPDSLKFRSFSTGHSKQNKLQHNTYSGLHLEIISISQRWQNEQSQVESEHYSTVSGLILSRMLSLKSLQIFSSVTPLHHFLPVSAIIINESSL